LTQEAGKLNLNVQKKGKRITLNLQIFWLYIGNIMKEIMATEREAEVHVEECFDLKREFERPKQP
jgi:hypothetical protein